MKAVCWQGQKSVKVEEVQDPQVINPRDAIIRVTSTAICGSDLHLYDNLFPTMRRGDILGHEFMGDVIAVGSSVKNLKEGDRVVVPFLIACGGCFFCQRKLYSCCDNSNPNATMSEQMLGYPASGLFGYSHLTGGYAGGQAELVRVPYADFGPLKVPSAKEVPDEKVLFLTDILPTGYMAAENCEIKPGDTIAVWGCGPVGIMTILSAYLLGAERVIAIDSVPERLELARKAGAEVLNLEDGEIYEKLYDKTAGRGPDACVDAVGMEAHGTGIMAVLDKAKQMVQLQTDRGSAIREAIQCVRKGGVVSIPGVYAGLMDKFPIGIAFAKGVTLRMGQTHMHRYMQPLLEHILDGRLDPTLIISHRRPLDEAPEMYDLFCRKQEGCTKVVLKPRT